MERWTAAECCPPGPYEHAAPRRASACDRRQQLWSILFKWRTLYAGRWVMERTDEFDDDSARRAYGQFVAERQHRAGGDWRLWSGSGQHGVFYSGQQCLRSRSAAG